MVPFFLALGLGACPAGRAPHSAGAASGSGDAAHPSIVGIWRVERFCDDDSAGRLYDPFGPHPVGYFIYSPSGQLSIQMAATPPVPLFAKGDLDPSGTESRALFDHYMGYFGTFTVTSESTVVHHVAGGTVPSYVGTDQPRVFQIRGDTLALGSSHLTWPCRVLIRERQAPP